VDNDLYQEARDVLARFAELEKAPSTFTPMHHALSLWNAASSGLNADVILDGLERYSKYPVPDNVRVDIRDYVSRYGRLKLIRRDDNLLMSRMTWRSSPRLCSPATDAVYYHAARSAYPAGGFLRARARQAGACQYRLPAEDLAG